MLREQRKYSFCARISELSSLIRVSSLLAALSSTVALLSLCCFQGCARPVSVTFDQVPQDDLGGVDTNGLFSGQVTGFRDGDHMMLFAFNDHWWVQPDVGKQMTPIGKDGRWSAQIHLGHKYAAALVRGAYAVAASRDQLPAPGGAVLSIATVDGRPTLINHVDHASRTLFFSGQEWDNTFHVSYYGGKPHYYLPQNSFVDTSGRLHLKIARLGDQWTCAEVVVARSLGYGTYRMTIENPKHMEPAAEFSFFTMDVHAPTESYREMDFHVTRWGDPLSKNAEYVVQPYYLAANVHSFELPSGQATAVLQWAPGSAHFQTSAAGAKVAEWSFKAGIPSSSDTRVYLNLCPFGYPKQSLKNEVEFVVSNFEYLP